MVIGAPAEPNIVFPIIMTYRTNDTSPLLTHILGLVHEFDRWRLDAPRGAKA
jgi:hypothetical protein